MTGLLLTLHLVATAASPADHLHLLPVQLAAEPPGKSAEDVVRDPVQPGPPTWISEAGAGAVVTLFSDAFVVGAEYFIFRAPWEPSPRSPLIQPAVALALAVGVGLPLFEACALPLLVGGATYAVASHYGDPSTRQYMGAAVGALLAEVALDVAGLVAWEAIGIAYARAGNQNPGLAYTTLGISLLLTRMVAIPLASSLGLRLAREPTPHPTELASLLDLKIGP
jgi:hypothetical protein